MDIFVRPALCVRTGDHTTTGNAYVVIADDDTTNSYFLVKGYKGKIVSLVCTLNDLLYKADASVDGTNWHPIVAETLILKDAIGYFTNTENWHEIRIQVKPNVAATHGKLAVTLAGSTL